MRGNIFKPRNINRCESADPIFSLRRRYFHKYARLKQGMKAPNADFARRFHGYENIYGERERETEKRR